MVILSSKSLCSCRFKYRNFPIRSLKYFCLNSQVQNCPKIAGGSLSGISLRSPFTTMLKDFLGGLKASYPSLNIKPDQTKPNPQKAHSVLKPLNRFSSV